MLIVEVPKYCKEEINYTLKVVLSEFLGLKYQVVEKDSNKIVIGCHSSTKKLGLNIDFFYKCQNSWLKNETMPSLPLHKWKISKENLGSELLDEDIPILYGNPGLDKNNDIWYLNCDIFGSIFFMLSRYEELIIKERDNHNRFPATSSVAFKEDFLNRPIVDEYIEVLFACFKYLWPNIKRQQQEYKKQITCDLDWPFLPYVQSFYKTSKKSLENLIYKKTVADLFLPFKYYLFFNTGLFNKDLYRQAISYIMDVNEIAGNKVSFYFITHCTSKIDNDFNMDSSYIRALFREIHDREHEIGLHPGYETFNNFDNFSKSVHALKRIFEEEKITQESLGGRQHYLRWDVSTTPQLWEKCGMDYDSSLYFADHAGYRCGTSREYSMYDLINRQAMRLKQRPLQVMECTVIENAYEGLGYTDDAFKRFEYFKNESFKFKTPFTLLWHNSHFQNELDKVFYKKLIK